MKPRATIISKALASTLLFGTCAAQAVTTTGNNFTMVNSSGIVGGTNDVVFTWEETYNTNTATAVVNGGLSSVTPFFGQVWTAYDIKVYGPGNYAISSNDTYGSPGCPFTALPEDGCASGSGNYNVTVGPDQVMAHMKFAWGTTQGIDVVNVWNNHLMFGPPPTCTPRGICTPSMYIGETLTSDPWSGDYQALWDGSSIDWDNDGTMGSGMIDGPFPGFAANFNVMGVTPIPVPASIWLLGSGLLGLVGVARRKKK